MNRIVAPPLEPREGAEVLRQADHRRLPENRNLDAWLREREVGTLVLGGVATDLGVESTARAAGGLGYGLVFAEDAMPALTGAERDAFRAPGLRPARGRHARAGVRLATA